MKRMRWICSLMGVCVVALLGIACKTEDNMHVYEYSGQHDDTIYYDYTGETYQYESFKREAGTTAPKNRKIQFLGKEYELTYRNTVTKSFLPFAEDFYYAGDMEFSFIENTDTFSGVFCYGETSIDLGRTAEKLVDEKDYKAIADDLVKAYVDISDYTQKCSSLVTFFEEENGVADCWHESYDTFYEKKANEKVEYTFTYIRNYKGYETFEKVFVTLNEAGELRELQFNAAGLFDDKKEPVAGKKEIEKKATQKMKDICKEGYAIKDVNCDIVLCINSEGKFFYLTFVDSKLEHLQDKTEGEESSILILAED